ncbi:uncharacterized protein LOC117784324 [Drosophila innubila]|uniref:uncharacterized protein LOC117784324 n=1 Tax=Drosophila innubila TaxID=198719 RepID=UPI00148E3CCB|nr:uncharacterized protein LOC117784324 [Drosophila innubila]
MSKRFIREFIECYRNETALWQSKSEAFKNKSTRNKAWQVLLTKYKEVDEDSTLEGVKKKVNSLRASYRRELRKIALSETFGAESAYKPTIWYFDDMDFLRSLESQIEEVISFDDGTETTETTKTTETETRNPIKRKHNESNESLEEPLLYIDTDNKRVRDDADVFAEGWAIIYRKLSKDQQIFAKRGIDEILTQGQLNMLSYASV